MKPESTAHRAGPFKQQNKIHKTGRHRSKGELDNERKGRSDVKTTSKRARRELSKVARKNRANQIRAGKKDESLMRKRRLGNAEAPPFLVTIISLCDDLPQEFVLRNLLTCDEEAFVTNCDRNISFLSVPRFKQRFSFLTPDCQDIYAVLDSLKVSDTVVFMWPLDGELSIEADRLLTCCVAQGLPACLNVVRGLTSLNGKKKETCRKQLTKNLEKWSLDTKFFSAEDPKVLLRQLGAGTKKILYLQRNRPHLLVESTSIEESDAQNSSICTLKVTGYLRGPALNVNGLVHVAGLGDFQMKQMDLVRDPHPLDGGKREKIEDEVKTLEVADRTKQESLATEADVDPMGGEQTWPTEEELKNAADVKSGVIKKVPKGTSEYQAMWILDDEDRKTEDSEGSDEEDEDMDGVEDPINDEDSLADDDENDKDETETVAMSESDNTDRYDAAMDVEEEKRLLEKFRKERENEMFPDEVDTPFDISAKERFQKYRGLKSFRTSPWDPKENLPSDYARIFQFENFRRTKKRVCNEERDGALNGWYICIHLANVPKVLIEKISQTTPLIVFGLLPHEQKCSLVNCVVRKQESCRLAVKSKDRLIFHVGYRRFYANPIFSQHTNGDKHKYERFLPSNGAVVASMYAPVVFPPASVLIFREDSKGRHTLVASGGVMDVNPSRVVIKRLILSGHPFKIHKRGAVVRHMFFNRDDIMWFKPVELRTKYGRRGHIKEPLGTHGHMKCHFEKPINSQDTVLLDLYKRVFPKWTYDPNVTPPTYAPAASTAKTSELGSNIELMEMQE